MCVRPQKQPCKSQQHQRGLSTFVLSWPRGGSGERVDIMTGSGGKVLSAYVEEVSPMRTHLRDDSWRPYVIPNKVRAAGVPSMLLA